LTRYPDYYDQFRSYCFLGDPMVGIPGAITGVEVETGKQRSGLVVHGPNPSSLGTRLRIDVASRGLVRLFIYDVHGRRVRRLLEENFSGASSKLVVWDGRDDQGIELAGGVYFARMSMAGMTDSRRLVLLK
jgi:hypothetical protein